MGDESDPMKAMKGRGAILYSSSETKDGYHLGVRFGLCDRPNCKCGKRPLMRMMIIDRHTGYFALCDSTLGAGRLHDSFQLIYGMLECQALANPVFPAAFKKRLLQIRPAVLSDARDRCVSYLKASLLAN